MVQVSPPFRKLNAVVYNKTRNFAGHTIAIEVSDKARVSAVKKAIEQATEVPTEVQWIIFGVRHLEDDVQLEEVGVLEGYTIYSVPTYVEIPEIPNLANDSDCSEMIKTWQSRTDRIFCLSSLLANIIAVILIPSWFKYSAWLVSDTNCVTNLDWNHKNWRPCVLKLRLQERCVFINHTLVHCDYWDHLGVTIHLINIPMQTEKVPSEQTAEEAEHTIIALISCLFSCIIFAFGDCAGAFITIVSSILVSIMLYALVLIWIQLVDAIVDHRPEVYYGYGWTFYVLSISFAVLGLALMISRMIYIYYRKENKKQQYISLERGPETLEMTLQGEPEIIDVGDKQVELAEIAEEEELDISEVERAPRVIE